MIFANLLANKKMRIIIIILSSLIVAFLGHLFFFTAFLEGKYMTGMNDGLSQMIPFKYFLYDEYTSGNFFYSNDFGLGGGIFSQLGYYFSTSIVFMATVGFTFLLEKMNFIGKPDLFYWADSIIFISIFRMTLIIGLTTFYFRYMKFKLIPAFIGAALYGTSIIYFRHVTYWEFFADAMIFLPLLLFGVEKIIREKKAAWFVVAVSLSMIDNFYFAYINFLLAGIYIVMRWLIPLGLNEVKKMQQVKLFLLSGLAGFGISAVFFIPSVYGYLNNHRPPFEDAIPLFGIFDNVLLNGRIVMLPIFSIVCLFLLSFYKNRLFRFFALLMVVLILMHYSPIVASVFNGFSAPQYRWEYFLSLIAGGVVAAGLQQLGNIKNKQLLLAIALTCGLYGLAYWVDPTLSISTGIARYLLACLVTIIVIALLLLWKNQTWVFMLLASLVLITSLVAVNNFQEEKLVFGKGSEQGISKEYMMSEAYYGENQRALIKNIQDWEDDPLARIDWMVGSRNNTPIVQNYKGFSLYSSILNKRLLSFYLTDLKIDMGRESVSRYASLGDRANLYSIFNGNYYIAKKGKQVIPYGFSKFAEAGDYIAYENNYVLPFVRTTNKVFSEQDLVDASTVAKERAMLEGIILEGHKDKSHTVPESKNIINQTKVEEVGSLYENDKLTVLEDQGGLDLVFLNPSVDNRDHFVSFFITRLENNKSFSLKVNDYVTHRKKSDSIYRTNVNELTVRVSNADRISIRLPKGTYTLKNMELHEENYEVLKALKDASDREAEVPVRWEGNHVNVSYDNTTAQSYMTLPIPFEKGWTVKNNGKKQKIEQANYAFTGIKLQEGINDIKLTYYPPFFFPALLFSILSILMSYFVLRKKN